MKDEKLRVKEAGRPAPPSTTQREQRHDQEPKVLMPSANFSPHLQGQPATQGGFVEEVALQSRQALKGKSIPVEGSLEADI